MATEYSCPDKDCKSNIGGNKKYYSENIGECPDCGKPLEPTQVKLKEFTGGTKGLKSQEQDQNIEEEMSM